MGALNREGVLSREVYEVYEVYEVSEAISGVAKKRSFVCLDMMYPNMIFFCQGNIFAGQRKGFFWDTRYIL